MAEAPGAAGAASAGLPLPLRDGVEDRIGGPASRGVQDIVGEGKDHSRDVVRDPLMSGCEPEERDLLLAIRSRRAFETVP